MLRICTQYQHSHISGDTEGSQFRWSASSAVYNCHFPARYMHQQWHTHKHTYICAYVSVWIAQLTYDELISHCIFGCCSHNFILRHSTIYLPITFICIHTHIWLYISEYTSVYILVSYVDVYPVSCGNMLLPSAAATCINVPSLFLVCSFALSCCKFILVDTLIISI